MRQEEGQVPVGLTRNQSCGDLCLRTRTSSSIKDLPKPIILCRKWCSMQFFLLLSFFAFNSGLSKDQRSEAIHVFHVLLYKV